MGWKNTGTHGILLTLIVVIIFYLTVRFSGRVQQSRAANHNIATISKSNTNSSSHYTYSNSNSHSYSLYKNQSEAAKKVAMSLLNSPGWKQEGQLASRDTKKYGRMYKLESTLPGCKASCVFNDLLYKDVTKWSNTVMSVRTLETIDSSTEIRYTILKGLGLASQRDAVFLRHWENSDGWYLFTTVSTTSTQEPHSSFYVRAVLGPGIMRFRQINGGSEIQILINTHAQGWIPTSIDNRVMAEGVLLYLSSLRKHCQLVCPL